MAIHMVRYSGNSMWPLFQEGDLLEIAPVAIDAVRKGDCILYRSPDGLPVVHRTFRAGAPLRTRGDALFRDDIDEVTPERLDGKVIYRYRAGHSYKVYGGWAGMMAGRFYSLAGRLDPQRVSRGGTVARWLQALSTDLLGWLWRRREIREVMLPDGNQAVTLTWGRWVVGIRNRQTGEWAVFWPWRVVMPTPSASRSFPLAH